MEPTEISIKTEVEAAATSAAYSDSEINLNFFKQDPGLLQSVKSEPSCTNDALLKEEILADSSENDSEQQTVHDISTTAGAGGLNEISSAILDDLINIKYESAEMDIGPTVLQDMDTHYTINKNMSINAEENTVVSSNEAMPDSGVKKENIRSDRRDGNEQQCVYSGSTPARTGDIIETFNVKYKFPEMNIGPTVLQHMDTYYTIHKNMSAAVVGCNEAMADSGVKKENVEGEWTNNKATSYNCYQTTTEVGYDDALMNSLLGQQNDFQKHLLHQHCTTRYSGFKYDTTLRMQHLLNLPEKMHKQTSRKAVTTIGTVASTSDESANKMTKTKQKPCQCNICEKGYSSKVGLNFHKSSIIKQKSSVDLKNNLVNYESHTKHNSGIGLKNNLVNYDFHTKRNHSNFDVKFAQRVDLTNNMGVYMGKKPYQCKICNARFTGNRNLTEHMSGEKPYQCKLCDARFAHSSALPQHVRVHTSEKPYQCKICDAKFAHSRSLTRHMSVHTGEKPYKCKICDARFAQNTNVTKHMRVHTGEKPYKCKICDAMFAQNTNLTQHMRLHTGEKPYQCKICDARFTGSSNLTKHMTRHTGEKPYQCKLCDASFAQSSTLTQHVRVHTGEKPYQCKICDARFAQNANLTQHMRRHTGEKPYQCKICHSKFTKNTNLTQHMRIHSGAKPYQCKICDIRCAGNGNLTRHMKVHMGEKRY